MISLTGAVNHLQAHGRKRSGAGDHRHRQQRRTRHRPARQRTCRRGACSISKCRAWAGSMRCPRSLATPGSPQVLVVSSLTMDGAETHAGRASDGGRRYPAETASRRLYRRLPHPAAGQDSRALGTRNAEAGNAAATIAERSFARPASRLRARRPDVIAVGASTGGISCRWASCWVRWGAIADLPIIITQHLPASFIPVFRAARSRPPAGGRPKSLRTGTGNPARAHRGRAPGHGHLAGPPQRRSAGRPHSVRNPRAQRLPALGRSDARQALPNACDGLVRWA